MSILDDLLKYTEIARSGGRIDTFQMVIAVIGIMVVFEAGRRTSRNLAILAAIFLAYNYFGRFIGGYLGHNGFTFKRVLITQFWGTQGILGTGAGVSATYIFILLEPNSCLARVRSFWATARGDVVLFPYPCLG